MLVNEDSKIGMVASDEPAYTQVSSDRSLRSRAFILDGQPCNNGERVTLRDALDPMYTILSSNERKPARAFIVPGGNASSFDLRYADEPTRTVGDADRVGNVARAFLMGDQVGQIVTAIDPAFTVMAQKTNAKTGRAWLSAGRVVSMTPRALARFQSLPDAYQLPERKSLACRIIGNGVAVACYAELLRSQI